MTGMQGLDSVCCRASSNLQVELPLLSSLAKNVFISIINFQGSPLKGSADQVRL